LVLGKLARVLDRAFFRPESLHPDVVTGLALAGPVMAGLILFRQPAFEFLGMAIAIGGVVHLGARFLRVKLETSPILVALVGVALCGPLSSPVWPALIALTAAVLEVARSYYWPRARIHTGVVAYAAMYLAAGGAMAAYQRPGSPRIFPEPIAQWSQFYGGATHFIEPITLYVGNVAGPVFATSLLAVVVGMAWLWYARRLSLLAATSFLTAGVVMAAALGYDPVFQLDSGPAWFVVGFALCDRRLLPEQPLARPVMAAAAGIIGVGLRAAHFYVEVLFLAVAAIEVLYLILELVAFATWRLLRINRRRPLAGTESVSA
jgi:NQR2, RnfD, RnfE family